MGGSRILAMLDGLHDLAARKRSSRGFALLVVMVLLLALSLMFGAVLQTTKQSTDDTRIRVERLKLTAALDGALASTAYQLSREFQSVRFGSPTTIRIGEIAVVVAVRPEMSKLDINYGLPENIRKLLEVSGIPSEASAQIARDIIARRGRARSNSFGATAEGAAPPHPFETLADLALVGRFGVDLPGCLEPDITVHTRSSGVDASAASARLRQAIYGHQPIPPSSYYSVVGGETARPDLYEIAETAKSSDGSVVVRRQVVIRLAADNSRPFGILSESSSDPDSETVSRACRRLAHNDR